ncbi:MAG: T9SS type A sorting domain-containing protein [Flavobacteriales bacterium]|nr:T9SS type A sorting domain-containing protein [Flavobacteriales bacterium]NCG29062.1 T9SS type A sorting domain-containing protein [Bacteroidota bacterium]
MIASCLWNFARSKTPIRFQYPNPASDYVGISFSRLPQQFDVSIVDVSGRVVYSKSYRSTSSVNVPLSSIASGKYTLSINLESDIVTHTLSIAK